MSISETIIILHRLDSLIQKKSTGSDVTLAEKFNVSRRMIHNYLNEMREMGAEISYDHTLRSYYYVNAFSVKSVFEWASR